MTTLDAGTGGTSFAVKLWVLFLANLLIAPVLAAVVLVVMILRQRHDAHARTVLMSLCACLVALVIVPLCALSLANTDEGYFWVVFICYWVTIHAGLVLYGSLQFVRALNDRPPIFSATLARTR